MIFELQIQKRVIGNAEQRIKRQIMVHTNQLEIPSYESHLESFKDKHNQDV